jgi:hypothetical protein
MVDNCSGSRTGRLANFSTLLHQYVPRGANFSCIFQSYLNAIALRLNQRPRKTLDFDTPADGLQTVLTDRLNTHPNSGHLSGRLEYPLWATSRHGVPCGD